MPIAHKRSPTCAFLLRFDFKQVATREMSCFCLDREPTRTSKVETRLASRDSGRLISSSASHPSRCLLLAPFRSCFFPSRF